MADYSVSDDAFNAFLAKAEADEKAEAERAARKGSGFNRTYETFQWLGLEKGVPHIVRFTGGLPESFTPGFKASVYDAQEIYYEQVKDDHGDRMQLRLPPHAEDIHDEHIMWRIINKVNERTWVDNPATPGKKTGVPKNANTHVYDLINHSGYSSIDPADANGYKYAKGWGGQQLIIANVIDREDDWCKTNKHTKLLCKKVTLGKDGVTVYPQVPGVPFYGFMDLIKKNLLRKHGHWDKYDVQITKNGTIQNPYEVKNASYYVSKDCLEELDASKVQFVSTADDLTPEEKQYGRYEIGKIYAPTKYKAIRERLGRTIAEVDDTFHTHFIQELDALVKREEEEAKAAEAANASENTEATAPVVDLPTQPTAIAESVAAPTATVTESVTAPVVETPVAAPVATRATRNIGTLAPEKVAALRGWLKLDSAQRAQIADVVTDATGKVTNILYTPDADDQCNCNNCFMPSPRSFLSCPACGCDFE